MPEAAPAMTDSPDPLSETVRTILVIEDQDTLRRNLALLLELGGYRVVTAENGRVGIETARRERPDLVICDVMMPEANGHEVVQTLRRDESFDATPFLFLSARGEQADLSAAREMGADGYLTKPVIREDLLAAVAKALASGRARDTVAAGATEEAVCADPADPRESGPEAEGFRESLAVLLTGTDLLRHHGRKLSETERLDQRRAMKEAGIRLASVLGASKAEES